LPTGVVPTPAVTTTSGDSAEAVARHSASASRVAKERVAAGVDLAGALIYYYHL
jgi:hypothetical protein